jgi:flagellar biosynthesis/type III secretory pathway protein FliH
MSLSHRVLRQPDIGDGSGSGSAAAPATIEELEEAAYARGVEAGRSMAADRMMAASDAIRDAVEARREELRQEFDRQQQELLDVAVRLAEVVLGHAQHDGGEVLARRIRRHVDQIDDARLTVALNPADADLIYNLGLTDIEVAADSSLRPGEARVIGEWARADITFSAALEALREVIADA